MRRTVMCVAAAVTVAVGLAACGDDDGGSKKAKERTQPKAAAEPDQPEAAPTVEVGDTGLGDVLVDADGKTLYLHADDQGTTSAVPDDLLTAWPPLTVEGERDVVAGEGVDESKLGTARQADGRLWVTYNGHLLYRFTCDAAPGDTTGHSLGDVWFALTPDGEQVAA
jgi:predicted lipoprotein with Yx(FWY)xxD motif